MAGLDILIRAARAAKLGEPQPISIAAGHVVFTSLIRLTDGSRDDFLNAPPARLAFWLVDNWWRIRWEPIPPDGMTPRWRLAHDLSSIGGGYVWPRLAIWGEGERVGLAAKSDPPGITGPVRYLTDALLFVLGSEFEEVVDRFLSGALDQSVGEDEDWRALKAVLAVLNSERNDPELYEWRRMEARLGFDPNGGPEELMKAMKSLSERYGEEGVEEAVMAAPGTEAATVLETEIASARSSRWICDFSHALAMSGTVKHATADPPWARAEGVARQLRRAIGFDSVPLWNNSLSELLAVRKDVFRSTPLPSGKLHYGLRLREREHQNAVALRSRSSRGRRFEMARALGDAIWARGDVIGPLAKSATARQKFQRAFAQSLLCPYDSLIAYMDTTHPTDDDITAAANYFHVAERVVQTVLVNKRIIERARLGAMQLEVPQNGKADPPTVVDKNMIESERLEDLVEAA